MMGKNQKEKKTICYTKVGGQAVIEGVMMRSPTRMALAVRKADGGIALSIDPVTPLSEKFKPLGWPIIRGVVSFIIAMTQGVALINRSAELSGMLEDESEPPSKFEQWLDRVTKGHGTDVVMAASVIVGLLLAVGMFFILPSLAVSLLAPLHWHYVAINLTEGFIRILLFLGYMVLVTRVPDIKRVFQYHGAEHKTISSYEIHGEATVEKAREMTRLHPRCGTSFLLLVMVVSILVFSLVGRVDGIFARVLTRILLLPVVAGLSYEVLQLLALRDNWFTAALRWPGMQLQRLTTQEPDDSMLEVAIVSFYAALEGREQPAEEEATHDNLHDVAASDTLGQSDAAAIGGSGSEASCPAAADAGSADCQNADLDAPSAGADAVAAATV